MTDKHPLPINGTTSTLSDWPTLIERAVDDVSRIVRSEAHMFQTNMGAALELQISKTIARLTNALMIFIGALFMLCALLFLLHQWLPWWQAFGAIGLAILLAGLVANGMMKT
jgi:hypothetical protein